MHGWMDGLMDRWMDGWGCDDATAADDDDDAVIDDDNDGDGDDGNDVRDATMAMTIERRGEARQGEARRCGERQAVRAATTNT